MAEKKSNSSILPPLSPPLTVDRPIAAPPLEGRPAKTKTSSRFSRSSRRSSRSGCRRAARRRRRCGGELNFNPGNLCVRGQVCNLITRPVQSSPVSLAVQPDKLGATNEDCRREHLHSTPGRGSNSASTGSKCKKVCKASAKVLFDVVVVVAVKPYLWTQSLGRERFGDGAKCSMASAANRKNPRIMLMVF